MTPEEFNLIEEKKQYNKLTPKEKNHIIYIIKELNQIQDGLYSIGETYLYEHYNGEEKTINFITRSRFGEKLSSSLSNNEYYFLKYIFKEDIQIQTKYFIDKINIIKKEK